MEGSKRAGRQQEGSEALISYECSEELISSSYHVSAIPEQKQLECIAAAVSFLGY